jgi:hypothetical protein
MGTNGNDQHTEQDEALLLEDPPVIYTTDEEGKNHQFQMVDMIEVEGQPYALLLYLGEGDEGTTAPKAEGLEDEPELVVMRITEENGDQVFEMIEDEAEYEKVLAYLDTLDDEEDEEDEA